VGIPEKSRSSSLDREPPAFAFETKRLARVYATIRGYAALTLRGSRLLPFGPTSFLDFRGLDASPEIRARARNGAAV